MDFFNLICGASFLLNDSLFKKGQLKKTAKKDPTLVTLRAFLSLSRSINTVHGKYIKYKKSCGQGFFGCFFSHHSSSLDTETEAAYDNYKSYD